MGRLSGKRSVEVNAARERCYAVAADIEQSPEWQGSLRRVDVLERDAEGRPAVVQTESDAKVKTIKSRLRFSFEPPSRIRWVQEEGDTRSLDGSWVFEELGDGRTRATYALAVDPGRVLGMLLRGPAEGKVREYLLGDAAEGLKGRAEDPS
jgi:uncharacterized membrane protein